MSQHEPASPLNHLVAWLACGLVALTLGFAMDASLQANGLYGARTFATETVTRKALEPGRRNSRIPKIYLKHRGQALGFAVLRDEYDAISVGEKLRVIVVPARFGLPLLSREPFVFLDKPGIKHDPRSRMAAFGLVLASNFGLLFLLFQFLLKRARRVEEDRAAGFQARRLGLTSR